mgnify:CR=1 FL=1
MKDHLIIKIWMFHWFIDWLLLYISFENVILCYCCQQFPMKNTSPLIFLSCLYENNDDPSFPSRKYLNQYMLFVCVFFSPLQIFHSYGYVTITREGLQLLTYAWQSWPLSSAGSFLACYNYCVCNLLLAVTLTSVDERLAVELSLLFRT